MATHSSVLAWRIPGTGEPGGLPSMGLHRVDTTEVTQQQQQHAIFMVCNTHAISSQFNSFGVILVKIPTNLSSYNLAS